MAVAISAKPSLSLPLVNSQRRPFLSQTNLPSLRLQPFLQLNQSHRLTIKPLNPNQSLHFPRNFGVSCAAQNGEGGETKNDVDEAGRGESTMPERFRYLTKEAPDQPVRWPWLIADGDTPLHISAGLGDEHMVKLLLQKGANKDIRNHLGKTAYDVAAEHGHTRLYDCLRLGDSLCTAARKGELRTVQRLIESGASINGRDQHGWTALHRAAFKGRIDVVRTLLENGIDVNAQDEEGYTALHCATESGQAEVTELLVKKGADVDTRTHKGVTCLEIAKSLQYSGIARVLLQGGASKDGYAVNSKQAPLPFGHGAAGQYSDNGLLKKKSARTRSLRSSFDRSMPLAVL